jgi:hypothetical protein
MTHQSLVSVLRPQGGELTRCLRAALLVLGLLLVAGCGKSTGTITGKVRLGEDLVTFGDVAFITEDSQVKRANIQPNGTYEVRDCPTGPVTITVRTYPLPPTVQPPDATNAPSTKPTDTGARFVPISERYAEQATSDLHYTVQPGAQTYDIPLKP